MSQSYPTANNRNSVNMGTPHAYTEHIDTETPTGRAMWQMIGVLAELERSLIAERTRASVTAARARGIKFGRKPKLTRQQIQQAMKLIEQNESPHDVAASFHVGRSTLYRAIAEDRGRNV